MGKKGPTRHLKREMTPHFWPIHRKERVWAVRTSPGPHGLKVSSPLLVVIRDFLGYAETAKEATMLIKEGKVLVDGKTRRDVRYSVGLMDVVRLTDSEEYFRVLPEHGGRFVLHPISQDEAKFKLCQIVGKTKVKGSRMQINLHDGRNMVLEDDGEDYSVNDIIRLEVPVQEISEHIEFKPGVRAIITGGRSQGTYGILIGLGSEPGNKRTATVRTQENEDVRTLANYVFAVGTETPLISLPGGK
jgi:small subunit ribosomal protein S4e